MQNQRGQLFPIWISSILGMIIFAGFIANYAQVLEARMRAQSAADSAAHGVLAAQVEEYNSIETLMFASWVEEVRARHLIGDLTLIARRSGNCTTTLQWDTMCAELYPRIYQAYRASVARYTDDVKLMGQLTSVKYNNVRANAINYVTLLNTGGNIGLNDSNLEYTLLSYGPREDPFRGPWSTAEDAVTLAPGTVFGSYEPRIGAGTSADPFWIPPETEVLACITMQPAFHWNFFGFNISTPTIYGIGRGAATAVPVTNEWMSPAMMTINAPGQSSIDQTVLLPAESWDAPGYDAGENIPNALAARRPSYQGDGWYDLTFDDYASTPNSRNNVGWQSETDLSIQGHTFTTAMNWWSAVNIATYAGRLNLTNANVGTVCK